MLTIVRTPIHDDDGSGTTGTIIDNTWKQDLYNQIDGALGKVVTTAPTGGPQTILGAAAGALGLQIQNGQAGATANAYVSVGNDATALVGYLQCYASTFTNAGVARADGAALLAGRPGGLTLAALDPGGQVYVATGGQTERLRVAADGTVLVNTVAQPALGKVVIAANGATNQAIVIQNNNAANTTLYFVYCLNSANGACGGIAQNGATSVVFNTASDARLKVDLGRATDLTALRAVVVHDFTWTADGVADRGIFAQEAYPGYPRAITPGTDETTETGDLVHPWMTDYSKFIPDLIVAWQQHDTTLRALQGAVAALGPR